MLCYINGHYVGDAEVTDMTLLGWHFLRDNCRLQFSPHTLVEPGQTLTVEPPLEMCRHGLHASMEPLDALLYAPGTIVCRVELSGKILQDYDKMCAEKRTVLWMADATLALHEFMCWCVNDVAERIVPFALSEVAQSATEAKMAWVRGEIDDAELRRIAGDLLQAAYRVTWDVPNMPLNYYCEQAWRIRSVIDRVMMAPDYSAGVASLAYAIAHDTITHREDDVARGNRKLEELLLGLAREQNIDNQEVSINE